MGQRWPSIRKLPAGFVAAESKLGEVSVLWSVELRLTHRLNESAASSHQDSLKSYDAISSPVVR